MSPRRSVMFLTATTALSVALLGGLPAMAADSPPDLPDSDQTASVAMAPVAPTMAEAEGTVTAFITLDTESGLDVADGGGSTAEVQTARETTVAAAEEVVPAEATAAAAAGAKPQRIATVTNLLSGTLVIGDAAQIRALAGTDHVTGIYRVVPKTSENAETVDFTQALATWEQTGHTGEGVTVGIIDTGIDYTHLDFGGEGSQEAYAAAYGENGTAAVPDGSYDTSKFVTGVGWDFAGTDYDPNAYPVPAPDPNPIDTSEETGGGHGSHVAGTAAGYGVTADGATFNGDYTTLSDVSDWQIGPGSAPEATLVAMKVFGDYGGSTNLVIPALDWAADPNGDGDFSDQLDVVNMSLGGDFAPADDPDTMAVDRLTEAGTIVVTSAGNGGDYEDVGGSPGNAASTITVANSAGNPTLSAMKVTAASDASLVKDWPVQNSIYYTGDSVSGDVVFIADDFDGCSTFTPEQQAAVAGKIVWLWWDSDDATRACGSAGRTIKAAEAGAIGAVFTNDTTVFSAGIAGDASIPSIQMTSTTTDTLLPAVKAGGLAVEIGPSVGTMVDTSVPDVLNPSSARGMHGSLGWAKPDVAAPGTNIVSAASATGTGSANFMGTSMSAPNVTGIAALVREVHPDWSVAQIKAAIVNTATNDVYTGPNRTGEIYGPARVGSGRVDALAATTTTLLAYNADQPAATSVSFGVFEVGKPITMTRTVTVANTGSIAKTVKTSFTTSTTAGAASISVSPARFIVAPGKTKTVTLTLTADPATISRDLDPTQDAIQNGTEREFVSRLTGRLVLTSGCTELRVPVQAVPMPSSALTAKPITFPTSGSATTTFEVSGRTLNPDNNWYSFATPLVLAATSPALDPLTEEEAAGTSVSTVKSGDIRYVGWGSTAPAAAANGDDPSTGTLNVGIATDGNWANLGTALYPTMYVDAESDGGLDYIVQVSKDGTDNTVAWTYQQIDGQWGAVAGYYVNEFSSDINSGVFDGSTVVMSMPLSLIPAGAIPTLTVDTESYYAPDGSWVIDQVDPFQVDPWNPPLWFDSNVGRQTSLITETTALTVHQGPGAASAKVLMLYGQNGTPADRAQVVDVSVAPPSTSTTKLKVSPSVIAYGSPGKATVTVTGATASPNGGTVEVLDGSTVIGSATLSGTEKKLSVDVALPGTLAIGKHNLTARFVGTPEVAASTSSSAKLTVTKATTQLTVTTQSWTIHPGTAPVLHITAAGPTGLPAPTGQIHVVTGSKYIVATLVDGQATVSLPRMVHTQIVIVAYTGDATYSGTGWAGKFKVR